MIREALLLNLEAYRLSPLLTAEELPMLETFIAFVLNNPDCFSRANKGHLTGSAWIVHDSRTKALLTHHKKLNIWVQLGGHADGNPDILKVAQTEALEESGIPDLILLSPEIYDIDIHAIPGPCAYHYDVRYLLQAPKDAKIQVSDESHDLAWIPFDQLPKYVNERSVLRMADKFSTLGKTL